MVRGLELVLGGLLISSGLIGPVADLHFISVGDQDLEGAVSFHEWGYNGSARIHAAEAGLRAAGEIHVTVIGDVVVEVFQFEEFRRSQVDTAAKVDGVIEWDYGWGWTTGIQTRVVSEKYSNATLRLAGEPDGRLFASPNGKAPASFTLVLQNDTDAKVAPSPYATFWSNRDGEYSYMQEAPVFILGHRGSDEPYKTEVSASSFDRLNGTGAIELILEGTGSIEIQNEDGTDSYPVWERDGIKAQTPDASHQASVEVGYESQYVRVTLKDAEFSMEFADIESVFQFRQASWDVNGTLEFTAQEGWVHADGSNHSLEEDRVKIEGNTTMDLQATGMGTFAQDLGDLVTPNGMTLDEPVVDGKVRGDSGNMSINGKPVLSSATQVTPPQVSLEEATLIAKILGGLLVAWGIVRTALPLVVGMVAKKPLKHPRRREIYAFLQETGMAHLSELHRATGIPRGSLEYHLKILRQGHLVSSVRRGGYHIYFLSTSEFCQDELQRLALLTDPTRRKISELLETHALVSQDELAKLIGIAKSNVSRQLAALSQAGLVDRQGTRDARYRATDLLLRWLTRRPRNGNKHGSVQNDHASGAVGV